MPLSNQEWILIYAVIVIVVAGAFFALGNHTKHTHREEELERVERKARREGYDEGQRDAWSASVRAGVEVARMSNITPINRGRHAQPTGEIPRIREQAGSEP